MHSKQVLLHRLSEARLLVQTQGGLPPGAHLVLKAGLNRWESTCEAPLTQPSELAGLDGCWLVAKLQLPEVRWSPQLGSRLASALFSAKAA